MKHASRSIAAGGADGTGNSGGYRMLIAYCSILDRLKKPICQSLSKCLFKTLWKKKKGYPRGCPYFLLVPKTGLEPAHPCEHKNLNLACLPIPPLRQALFFYHQHESLASEKLSASELWPFLSWRLSKLSPVELTVEKVVPKEFRVGTGFKNSALIKNNDLVGVHNR